jgi:hypothetical protein
MRYKFATLSGSEYLIDTDKMTWKRRNLKEGHESIIGLDINEGRLFEIPEIWIGERASIQYGEEEYDYIHTTQVVRIELLSDV